MGGINICITVDWEGEDLSYVNNLKQVRKRIGEEIPFTHFICPNYFSPRFDAAKNADLIRTGVQSNDEIGLHLHCYRDLIEDVVGIPFRTEENYHNVSTPFEATIERILPFLKRKISGRGVPLSVYDAGEIKQIIEKSRALLQQHIGRQTVDGFRAGGWIANDAVLDAVAALDFGYDSSAVPPAILSQGHSESSHGNKKDDYGDRNGIFTEHILKLWGYNIQEDGFLTNRKIRQANPERAIHIGQQPFGYGNLLEIPNNVGLTDFSSGSKTVLPLIKSYLKQLESNPDLEFTLVYGCHQEGDSYYKALLVDFVVEVQALKSDLITFVNMSDVCEAMKAIN